MHEGAWIVVTGVTCWAMGATTGWVIGHRHVLPLIARIRAQQATIDGMSRMQDDLVVELRKIAAGAVKKGVGVIGPGTTGNT